MAEAAHGTAPALFGKNVANPLAMILAGAALLTHMRRHEAQTGGRAVREASLEAVAAGIRTADLGGHARTTEFTDEVIRRVRQKLEVWSTPLRGLDECTIHGPAPSIALRACLRVLAAGARRGRARAPPTSCPAALTPQASARTACHRREPRPRGIGGHRWCSVGPCRVVAYASLSPELPGRLAARAGFFLNAFGTASPTRFS